MARMISEARFKQLVKITRLELTLLNLKYVDLVFNYDDAKTHEVHLTPENPDASVIPDSLEKYYKRMEIEPSNNNCFHHSDYECKRYTMRTSTPDMYYKFIFLPSSAEIC